MPSKTKAMLLIVIYIKNSLINRKIFNQAHVFGVIIQKYQKFRNISGKYMKFLVFRCEIFKNNLFKYLNAFLPRSLAANNDNF